MLKVFPGTNDQLPEPLSPTALSQRVQLLLGGVEVEVPTQNDVEAIKVRIPQGYRIYADPIGLGLGFRVGFSSRL